MPELAGKKNVYTCEGCGESIVTVNLEEGVTPFMVGCRINGCSEQLPPGRAIAPAMKSHFYRVDQTLEPTHEWYRPRGSALSKLSATAQEHVANGGLLLREVAA